MVLAGWIGIESTATVLMMKYCVTTFLPHLLEPQRLKPSGHFPGFERR